MTVNCLVVDDSAFFQKRIVAALEAAPDLRVIATASDGREAIAKTLANKPDVITMDIEMPVLDGIGAVRRIMAIRPTPVLMFSSLTHEGARATLDALEAGAADFLPKRFEDIAQGREDAMNILRQRVRALGQSQVGAAPQAAAPPPREQATTQADIRLVVLGASTGGPVALQRIMAGLPANFPYPILLIQHLPATFTPAFAQRLDHATALTVRQAADGDELLSGLALLAPGGQQTTVVRHGRHAAVRIQDGPEDYHYKPSLDLALTSAALVYPRQTLAVVLTGMGADGREGANKLKRAGSQVWAQDAATSVIYGMPAAVANIADRVLPLQSVGPALSREA